MATIITVPASGQARSRHVQQIIDWLRGLINEPVSLTGLDSAVNYALTVRNVGSGGRALAVRGSTGDTVILEALNAGVIVRPYAASGVPFRVRNFADNADLFSVDADGTVSIGVLSGARVGNYLDVTQTSAPSNPSASRLRVYSITGSDTVRFRNSDGTERILVDTDSGQTITGKAINNSTFSNGQFTGPIISNYAELNWSTNPGGTASKSRLWARDDNGIYYTLPGGTIVTLLTSLNTPGLSALGFARPLALGGG